jgi:hypothetical protein
MLLLVFKYGSDILDYKKETGSESLNCRNKILEECCRLHEEGPNEKYQNLGRAEFLTEVAKF